LFQRVVAPGQLRRELAALLGLLGKNLRVKGR
jgi:hypothetical protein